MFINKIFYKNINNIYKNFFFLDFFIKLLSIHIYRYVTHIFIYIYEKFLLDFFIRFFYYNLINLKNINISHNAYVYVNLTILLFLL